MNDNNKILPCPICGSSAVELETYQVRKGWEAIIHCECLLSMSTITCDTEEEAKIVAISSWNKRVKQDEISPATCTMCLDCPDNCLFDGKHPTTREQVRAETAKEFAEKAISEVFEKITQRFCDIYYSGLNRECPDSILSEHYQSAFDECKEIVKNSITELAASFGMEIEE